ncbi:MAG: hypothetical protein AB1916_06365 [Thermodesulfobacteriota bacterium]
MAMRENWCVICGAVRNLDQFTRTVIHFRSLRERGVVQGIVLSTWFGEIDAHPGLRRLLERYDIATVETADPGDLEWGNLYRQSKQIRLGLELCPENAYVLKTRTDKNMTTALWEGLFRHDLAPDRDAYPGFPDLFEERIAVSEAFLFSPFFASDFEYYGKRSDLQRLIDLNDLLRYCCMYNRLVWTPEERLFGSPFLGSFPITEAYFRRCSSPIRYAPPGEGAHRHSPLSPAGIKLTEGILALTTSHSFGLGLLMTWWAILGRYFHVGMSSSFCSEEPMAVSRAALAGGSLAELLHPSTSGRFLLHNNTGQPDNFFINARNDAWLSAFVNGDLKEDRMYRRFRSVFDEVSSYAFHSAFRDTLACPHPMAEDFVAKLSTITGPQLPFAVVRGAGNSVRGHPAPAK